MAAAAAGIDVGDSASVIAVARKGGVDVLLNKESKRETPSVVTFTAKRRHMGTDAVGAMSTNPHNTVSQLKRILGKIFSDPAVQSDLQYFPFKVVEGPAGDCLFEVQYLDKPTLLTAEQLMAMLLVDLREIAEKEQGGPVTDAVISVPVFFTEPERHAMLAAAQVAGLNCLRLMNDTTATALAYGIYKTDLPEDTPLHVVFTDVGFASTQVCVVALKKGQLQVLSNAWDRDLGGRDFDNVLFEHFVKEFGERYKLDIRSNARASYRLRLACEKMKKVLTTNPEAPISVECLMNDIDVQGMMTRETFEEEAKPILDRLLVPIRKAVEDAGLTPEALASVEVVGGSSRVPAVANIIRDYFQKEPSRTLNAKETVARGCALQCAMLSPAFKVRDFHVQDSFPYGVQFTWAKDEGSVTSVVFEKGSSVPSAKMLTFYRSEAFTLTAEYTPDSDIPSTADRSIGSWQIGPFQVPAGTDKAKIKVKVSLNLNGVVAVESAHLIEEEEYEEEVPVTAQPAAAAQAAVEAVAPAADHPMDESAEPANADAAPGNGDAGGAVAEGSADAGPKPMEQDTAAQPAAAPATQKVLKRRVKKHSVPFSAATAALPAERLQALFESECEMALQARVQEETNDAKNALEAYIYGLRNKLYDQLAPYVQEDAKASLQSQLDDLENWLYDEGEDQPKSVYVAKLADVVKLGQPIEARAAEDAARPAAAAQLRGTAEKFMAAARSNDPQFSHIDAADKQRIVEECEKALAWLAEKQAVQQQLHKYDDPALVAADILKKNDMLRRLAEPILNKPPPPPPKTEEAKPAAGADAEGQAPQPEAGREQMETEAAEESAQPAEAAPMET